jgi:hypothetical protein
MAKWYSDPIPYINRSALFGVDPNYIQPLDWKPVVRIFLLSFALTQSDHFLPR